MPVRKERAADKLAVTEQMWRTRGEVINSERKQAMNEPDMKANGWDENVTEGSLG